jgi:hypothetical protein
MKEHQTYTCDPKEVKDYTLFHRCWSHAVNSPDYRKDEWQELEIRLRRGAIQFDVNG